MDSTAATAQDGHGTSAARLLGLLAVLLGLLAMHGLAGTHHASAAVPLPPAVAQGSGAHAHSPDGLTATLGHSAPLTDLHTATGGDAPGTTVSAVPGSPCHEDCRPDAAVLCLAVLVATGVAALLAAGARRRAGPHVVHRRPSVSGPPAPRRPPPATPDPVEDLCVSRT